MQKTLSATLSVGAALAMTAAASSPAFAQAFGVRAQSTQFLGSAFAGSAAGGALSSMFWNPAAVGQFDGMRSESSYSFLFPTVEVRALPGSTLVGTFPAGSGDIGTDAIVPATYVSNQISPNMVFGFSINAPFGLVTEPRKNWAGQTFTRKSKIETYNFSPTVAYRITPGIIVGGALQVEYIRAKLVSATSAGGPSVHTKGDDIALGFRLGVLWVPSAGTSIGLGFRSSLDHTLEGSLKSPAFDKNRLTADLETPETVTLSLRHALTAQWTVLGTAEWSNWSRLDKVDFVCASAAFPPCASRGFVVDSLVLGWHDSWFFSAGLEYAYSEKLTLRGGAGYELSPIQDPEERIPQLPDSNRIWTGIGASYKLNSNWCRPLCESTLLDFSYTHVFLEDARLNRTQITPNPNDDDITLLANSQARQDIISIGLKTKWGGAQRAVKPIK